MPCDRALVCTQVAREEGKVTIAEGVQNLLLASYRAVWRQQEGHNAYRHRSEAERALEMQ